MAGLGGSSGRSGRAADVEEARHDNGKNRFKRCMVACSSSSSCPSKKIVADDIFKGGLLFDKRRNLVRKK